MCENLEEAFKTEGMNEDDSGVLLGYWDQEKTATVIKDLENSVSFIEGKCKKLLQELMYYQYYWEEASNSSVPKVLPNSQKRKSSKNSYMESSSVPDIAFRKAVIQSHGFEESFREKFERKLTSINKALSEAADKIGLKESQFLFPTDDYLHNLEEKATGNLEKNWPKIKNEFFRSYVNGTVKSDLTLDKHANEGTMESEVSRITKNELDFYTKLSKSNLLCKKRCKKTKKLSTPAGKANWKFRKSGRRYSSKKAFSSPKKVKPDNSVRNESVSTTEISASDLSVSDKKLNVPLKQVKKKIVRKIIAPLHNCQSSHSTTLSKTETTATSHSNLSKSTKKELDIDTLCLNLVTTLINRNPLRENNQDEKKVSKKEKVNLRDLAKKTIPFTTCTSTTKSHNVGMNVQQYISARKQQQMTSTKYRGRTYNTTTAGKTKGVAAAARSAVATSQVIPEVPKIEQIQILPQPPKSNAISAQYIVTTYPWSPKGNSARSNNDVDASIEINCRTSKNPNSSAFTSSANARLAEHEINRVERKDVWISKPCAPNANRKYRSRYTKTTPESFIGYHKSTTKQYTNERGSMIKSESKTTYAVGSNIMVSDCQRTDYYGIKKQDHCNNASGDTFLNIDCQRLKVEWSKIFAMFSNLSKKYAMLKEAEKVDGKPSDKALKSLENEIDHAIEKYREFLNFYSKLKQRLKSMKVACDAQAQYNDSSFIFSASYEKRNDSKKPTYSMVLKDTLRKVQDLQDKIRLVNDS